MKNMLIWIVIILLVVGAGLWFYFLDWTDETKLYFGTKLHRDHQGAIVEVDLAADDIKVEVHEILDLVLFMEDPHLDINRGRNELYVGGYRWGPERGGAIDVVDLETMEVNRSFYIDSIGSYSRLRLTPNGKFLYVSNPGPDMGEELTFEEMMKLESMWKLDALTGEKVGGTAPRGKDRRPFDIRSRDFFTEAGQNVVQIRGDFIRKFDVNSDTFLVMGDIDSPEVIQEIGGLYPDDRKDYPYPFPHVEHDKINFRDRDTGEVLAMINLQDEIAGFQRVVARNLVVDETIMRGYLPVSRTRDGFTYGDLLVLDMKSLEILDVHELKTEDGQRVGILSNLVLYK